MEQNAEVTTDVTSQQTTEAVVTTTAATKEPYTPEEMKAFTPTSEIDMERVPEPFRPVIENMTRDYKEVQKGYTQAKQELADIKRTPEPPEKHFDDPQKDQVFKNYLKDPLKVISDINSEIANLEAVIPEDGTDEYRKARRSIAYWNGVKDEFQVKRSEVSERNREAEIAEAKVAAELGTDAPILLDYAKTLGFSERDFRSRPTLRASIKTMYLAANPGKGKEIKPSPQQTTKPSGQGGGSDGAEHTKSEDEILFDDKTTTAERMEIWAKRKKTR